jgi:hypothetical protein
MGWRGNLLRNFLARRGEIIAGLSANDGRRDLEAIRTTRARAPVLVQDSAALVIVACARAAASLGGSMAEAGVYRGGTARLICQVKGGARLHLFDVFDTLQGSVPTRTSEVEQEVRDHFGSVHGCVADVRALLAPYERVELHPGLFPDSARHLEDERFSFVHLDLDLERGTMDALEFFFPRLLLGGVLLADDFHTEPVRRAFERYFSDPLKTVIALPWGQGLVVKAR